MSLPTLSVVVPHYNHGKFLRQAIQALLEQSVQPFEIIIVDDGSTDGSESLLQELASAHPLLRVVYNDRNRGVGYTCNHGLSLCRGDYVYLTAADDRVLPGFFARAMTMAREYPQAGLVYGKMARTNEQGEVTTVFEVSAWQTARYATPQEFLDEQLAREEPGHSLSGATIYRREPFQALGGYRTELGHWMDTFVARAIGLRYGVCYVPEIFMQWRYSESGFCGSSRPAELLRIVKRSAELMRTPPFCQWFPESHVVWWEHEAIRSLFHIHSVQNLSRVLEKWPLLGRWREAGGVANSNRPLVS